MTTSVHGARRSRAAVLRVPAGPRVVTVRHGQRRLQLWRRRVVLGGLLAGAMTGSLLGVAWSLRELGTSQPLRSLEAYGVGAGVGAVGGLVLGVLLSALIGLVARFLLPNRVPARRTWVRHPR